jgi:hypothetical protein
VWFFGCWIGAAAVVEPARRGLVVAGFLAGVVLPPKRLADCGFLAKGLAFLLG